MVFSLHNGEAQMRIKRDERLRIKKRIAEKLAASEGPLSRAVLQVEFPNVPETTLRRWLHKLRATSPNVRNVERVKCHLEARTERASMNGDPIPETPPPADLAAWVDNPTKAIDLLFEAAKSIRVADDLDRLGRDAKGEITDEGAEFVIASVRERTRAVGVLAKIQGDLFDIARIRSYHVALLQTIARVLAHRDPALFRLVLEEMRSVNAEWSMQFDVNVPWR
jgi:hypothetical protein